MFLLRHTSSKTVCTTFLKCQQQLQFDLSGRSTFLIRPSMTSPLVNQSTSMHTFVCTSSGTSQNGVTAVPGTPSCSASASHLRRSSTSAATWTDSSLPERITSMEQYHALYKLSVDDPNHFWKMAAERLDWYRFPTQIKNASFDAGSERGVDIKWYEDGTLNVCYNCLDRHIEQDERMAQQVAFIFEPDQMTSSKIHITYGELLHKVKRFANVLKAHGVKKGDRVTLFMPMIPETCIVMLACARIGAVHSVVFGGFSASNLAERVGFCESKVIVTSDTQMRGGKLTYPKLTVDEALKREQCKHVDTVLVFNRKVDAIEGTIREYSTQHSQGEWTEGRDFWVHDEMGKVNDECAPEQMNAEDPLFILYTSGSTGKPKGVVHSNGGYLVFTSLTFKYVFDYKPGEIYMCTADVGWITGHSYVLYGPLANGATSLVFEGVQTYPDAARGWKVIDKHQVNIFYTAPTAIRQLMGHGDEPVKGTSRKSLRLLGTVGEPINPEAWKWYHDVVGDGRCPVVDTWWQTETGGHMITPLHGVTPPEPGSATLPFFGIQTQIVQDKRSKALLTPPCKGELVIKESWPGQARTLYGDHKRFVSTYFERYPGFFLTGDGCEITENGYHYITGRVDDVLVISGHNIGTKEVEDALVQHKDVHEAAVVGYPDPKKTQGMYCFVSLNDDVKETDELKKELLLAVRKTIGSHVQPDFIHFAPNLPKTRSGKIMRRILRKIVEPDIEHIGDVSTLDRPGVVDELIAQCPRTKRS